MQLDFLGIFRIAKIDGIIGWPLFMKCAIEIDYKNKRTTIKWLILWLRPKPRWVYQWLNPQVNKL